ncbi:Serine/threonine protein kinase [Nannocystis exedens]|uniref:Serine/threonine protein kinase n=1 Tax=Nannocystis exedens TaxID=54 RepID=A0A1I2ASS6_9BACT|nr:serine/threonine-protein kinase [Nannocystis exedens]PCC74200.1 Serine/threonine-protein kinase StkP [Nannocystis exedens]SFE45940.1 Serine/threonine protein kinase [Nannocystis exedens]
MLRDENERPTAATVSSGTGPRAQGLPAPARIGRYTLLGMLGRGGMGEVHLARDELLGRRVALKLLGTPDARPTAQARLLREAQALARLSHPNVVTIHEAGEHEGRVYLAMELVVGDTLRDWLRAHRPAVDVRLEVALQAGRGLAAAHDRGLVHRDFKPDNVMVGEDGRVRVMDFGLARLDARDLAVESGAPVPHATVVGAVLGTPGYMAPEQREGRPAGVVSDIYGYCVVVCELFTGKSPPPDADADTVRATLRHGAVAGTVPGWLAPLVERGLDPRPAARWPTMHALLDAIEAAMARRRQRRIAGRTAAAALIAGVLALGGVALHGWWDRAEREATAADRMAAIAAADAPEPALSGFIAEPDHRRTRALGRAWLLRGDRALADRRIEEALAAYARAYVEATDPGDVAAAMRALAAVFAARGDAPELARVVAEQRARGLGDPTVDGHAAIAALGLRDGAGAVDSLAPDDPWRAPLAALARGQPLGWLIHRFDALGPGGPAAFAAVSGYQDTRLLDRSLATIGRAAGSFPVFPGTTLAARDAWQVVDLAAPAVELWRTEHVIAANAGLRLADGRVASVYSHVWPHQGFWRLADPPSLGARPAHAGTHRTGAALIDGWSGDLDGDGRDELVAAFDSPADDVRVFQADARGELELVDRRALAGARAVAGIRRGSSRAVVVAQDAAYTVFVWTGAALTEIGTTAMPAIEALVPQTTERLLAADLDGDGTDELLHPGKFGQQYGMRIVRDVGGQASWRTIGGIDPWAAVQFDADAADEVVVRMLPGLDAWVLGAGDQAPPDLRTAAEAVAPPDIADAWLADRVARTEALAAMGRSADAATAFVDLAAMAGEPQLRHHLLDRAAALWTAVGDDAQAEAIDRGLAGPRPLARRAAALTRLGRWSEAHAAATALAGDPQADAAAVAEARRLVARLDPLVRVGVVLDPDLEAWRFVRPAGLRRDPVGERLEVAAAAGPAPLAEVSLAWDGSALAFEAEVETSWLESAGCLTIGVDDEHGAEWLAIAVCGSADERSLHRGISCRIGDQGSSLLGQQHIASAATPGRVVARVAWFADGTVECAADGVKGRWTAADMPSPGAALRFVVSARSTHQRPALAKGALREIRVHGARLAAPSPETAWDAAARHLVDDDPAAAAAVLSDMSATTAREHAIRLVTHDRLGDLAALERAAVLAAPVLLDPAARADLALLVRTRPLVAAALVGVGAPLLPAMVEIWSGLRAHLRDGEVRPAALAGLHALAAATPTNPDEYAALARLLALRGLLAMSEGRTAAAIRDLEAALELADPTEDEDEDEELADVHAALARLLAPESPTQARMHVQAAVHRSVTPERTRERMLADPALAGLLTDVGP